MEIDLEIGGSDQTFNMLCGRQLVKDYLGNEKFVMTTPLLADASGRKIGKTEGNAIALTDGPEELYGKIMAFPDEVIAKAFEYLTSLPMEEIEKIAEEIRQGKNQMQHKKHLAHAIVAELNNIDAANTAQESFEKIVQRRELPTEIEEVTLSSIDEEIVDEDMLVDLNLTSSKSEAKRLFEQGGIEVDGKKITDTKTNIVVTDGMIVKIGKRKVIRLRVEK
jgi:tyrosyl-tRNA synthetase